MCIAKLRLKVIVTKLIILSIVINKDKNVLYQ